MYALEIENVSKTYGKFHALKNINFDICRGDFVGLIGVNGAGKTSLISSIAGINKFEGKIRVMGHDVIKDLVKAKSNLGVVPQELAFDPFLTVYQTLKFQSGLYNVKNNKKWIYEILERMHLENKMHSNTRELSGGMKRRLMVAQALVHKPPLIILDEPTAGVDVEIRKSLWKFLNELSKKGHTFLLTTHYMEEVETLCNKIIMIDKGEIVTKNTKDEFMSHAKNLSNKLVITTKNGVFTENLLKIVLMREDNNFIIDLKNIDDLRVILDELNQAQVQVENIHISRPKLEDTFINNLNR